MQAARERDPAQFDNDTARPSSARLAHRSTT